MTKYVVTAYKVEREFDDKWKAQEYFEEVKRDFTCCELKEVNEGNGRYYAKSLEIFWG